MFSCQQYGYTTDVKSNLARHMKRKTGCCGVNANLPTVNANLPTVNANLPTVNANLPTVNANLPTVNANLRPANDHNNQYITLEDDRVRCVNCDKELLRRNFRSHAHICKGVPKSTCRFCLKCFSFSSALSRHQNICKQNPANIPPSIQQTIVQNINNITNNNITNNITNITIKFGNEDMSYIEGRKEVDERYAPALACFSDTLDLAFFNSDHPENQTVRKTNKKSDLIELRVNQDDWAPTESKVAIPKIKTKLASLLNVPIDCEMRNTNFKDMLHSKTQRGPISEEHILERHNGPPLINTEEQMENFEREINEMSEYIKIYTQPYETKNEFLSDPVAKSIREEIMEKAKDNDIQNFSLRNAHSVLNHLIRE